MNTYSTRRARSDERLVHVCQIILIDDTEFLLGQGVESHLDIVYHHGHHGPIIGRMSKG